MAHLTRETSRKIRRPQRPKAFTLVEILIVVAILGILAAIVVPQFVSATTEASTNALKMDLHRIRTQIGVYHEQHGEYPELANFVAQMTQASNLAGATAAPGTAGYTLGPYVLEVPSNKLSTSNTVGNGAVGTSDWYYDEDTGDFRANNSADARTW